MPLTNVELIKTSCPQCGGTMDVPKSLNVLHCMYCGNKMLVSERKPDVHYHITDGHKTIDNYIKLSIRSLESGNHIKANGYMDKAREINVDVAEKIIKDNSINISNLYFLIAKTKYNEFINIKPIMDGGFNIINVSEIDASMNECKNAFENSLIFNKDNFWSEYYLGKSYEHYATYLKNKNYDKCIKIATGHFINSFKINPRFKNVKNDLIKYKFGCKKCGGSGDCPKCKGLKKCTKCLGNGKCNKCNGDGEYLSLFGKIKQCSKCNGTGTCINCNGSMACLKCHGEGKCMACNGIGIII